MNKRLLSLVIIMMALLVPKAGWGQEKFVGGDISMLPKYEEAEVEYKDKDGNTVSDVIGFFKQEGMNAMRVRLFVNPSNASDEAKDQGVIQDLEYVKSLGKRIKDAGLKLLLDFHYSDTWADPSQQWTPAAWKDLSDSALAIQIYDYTKDCLQQMKTVGATPDFIQTGNEISYGMLWGTEGSTTYRCYTNSNDSIWNRFYKLLRQASKACREECPDAKIILHNERVNNTSTLTDFFNRMNANNIDYDIIGLSYYPEYHGSLETLESALSSLETNNYGKDIIIAETGYSYAWELGGTQYDYTSTYPRTEEGQRQFTADLIDRLNQHSNVKGLFWWWPEDNGNKMVTSSWWNAGLYNHDTGQPYTALYELKNFVTDSTTPIEPYAVLTDNTDVISTADDGTVTYGKTLTFYYDDQKEARNGMSVGPFTDTSEREWYADRDAISSVVFDTSFAKDSTLTSTAHWFGGCMHLTSITDISNLYTGNVVSMNSMFYECWRMTSLDVRSFKTDNVTDMSGLFNGCSGLTSLDLSHFNTENVTSMSMMFTNCLGLTSLDVSTFNTANVTSMSDMFTNCLGLTSLDVSNFNTANVQFMNCMFERCMKLKKLDLTKFDTGNVLNMESMFANCESLEVIDMSSFNTAEVRFVNGMFSGCPALKTIYVGNDWSTGEVIQGSSMFTDCTNLVGGAGTTYDADHTDYTYAHIDGGTANPGYFTDKNAVEKVSTPVITISNSILAISSNTDESSIYYSLDGSQPTKESLLYTAPVVLTNNCIIRTIAAKEGMEDSDESTQEVIGLTYTQSLPTPNISHNENIVSIIVPSIGNVDKDVTDKVDIAPSSWGGSSPEINLGGEWTASLLDDNNNVTETYGVTLMEDGSAVFPSPCLSGSWSYSNGTLTMFHDILDNYSQGGSYSYHNYELTTSTPANPIEFEGKRYSTVGNWITESNGQKNVRFTYNGESLIKENMLTSDGRNVSMSIANEEDSEKTGELLYQNITGLENGYYTVELYAKSVYSSAQSMSTDVTYLFANDTRLFIPIEADKEIHEHNVYSIGVMVTDETLRLGLGKERIGANWHALQIKSLKKNLMTTDQPIENATIYYTLNGETPDATSNVYQDSIVVRRNGTIKAIAMKDYYLPSEVATFTVDWFEVPPVDIVYDGRYFSIEADATALVNYSINGGNAVPYTGGKIEVPGLCTVHVTAEVEGMNTAEADFSVNSYFDGRTAQVRDGGSFSEAFQWCGTNAALNDITAIMWNKSTALSYSMMQGIENPNLLLYVSNKALAPGNVKNIVVGDSLSGYKAQQITLTDTEAGNGNFYCPIAFTANRITYQREFRQQTETGKCRGWETIVLPFTVQSIMHERNGQLRPFAAEGSGRPFWLREMGSNGLVDAKQMEANKAYVISMPNEPGRFDADYQQGGRVTFSGYGCQVPVTSRETSGSQTIRFIPALSTVAQSDSVYALNVGEEYAVGATIYDEGSIFVAGWSDVRPFHCYTQHTANSPAPRFMPLSGWLDESTTNISEKVIVNSEEFATAPVYNLKGQRVAQPTKGIYIMNGKTVKK